MSVSIAFFLLAAAASPPVTTAPTAAASAPAAKEQRERKICKADERFTGTRMRKKICLTESEWANRSATTANDLKNMGAR